MKVCLVSGEYPPMRGGVADYTALVATELASAGVDVSIITSERAKPSADNEIARADVPVHHVRDWRVTSWRRITGILKDTGADVLHIQYQTGAFHMNPAVNLFPYRLKLPGANPRVVVTLHDLKAPYLFPKAGAIRRLANTLLIRGADAVVVTNAEDANSLVGGRASQANERLGRFGPRLYRIPIGSNIAPVPPSGYDRARWRDRLGVVPDEILLSYFGFLGPSKGVDLLFEALGELWRRNRNVRLVMVGGSSGDNNSNSDRPYEQRIRSLADQPTYRARIIWTGFTTSEQVTANLLASDLCVLPFREGASLRHGTLVAAIVHGIPIVTTTPAVMTPLKPDLEPRSSVNCLLVPRENVGALVEAIEKLIDDPELRRQIGAGARSFGREFGWGSIARDMIGVYSTLLAKKLSRVG